MEISANLIGFFFLPQLYAVQVGYMDVQEVVYCSGDLYAVQGGYMLFRRVILMFMDV